MQSVTQLYYVFAGSLGCMRLDAIHGVKRILKEQPLTLSRKSVIYLLKMLISQLD
ncbi:MAG TPA: hypothetical protein VGG97_05750 [Bryobacteraceae bacterium]